MRPCINASWARGNDIISTTLSITYLQYQCLVGAWERHCECSGLSFKVLYQCLVGAWERLALRSCAGSPPIVSMPRGRVGTTDVATEAQGGSVVSMPRGRVGTTPSVSLLRMQPWRINASWARGNDSYQCSRSYSPICINASWARGNDKAPPGAELR